MSAWPLGSLHACAVAACMRWGLHAARVRRTLACAQPRQPALRRSWHALPPRPLSCPSAGTWASTASRSPRCAWQAAAAAVGLRPAGRQCSVRLLAARAPPGRGHSGAPAVRDPLSHVFTLQQYSLYVFTGIVGVAACVITRKALAAHKPLNLSLAMVALALASVIATVTLTCIALEKARALVVACVRACGRRERRAAAGACTPPAWRAPHHCRPNSPHPSHRPCAERGAGQPVVVLPADGCDAHPEALCKSRCAVGAALWRRLTFVLQRRSGPAPARCLTSPRLPTAVAPARSP